MSRLAYQHVHGYPVFERIGRSPQGRAPREVRIHPVMTSDYNHKTLTGEYALVIKVGDHVYSAYFSNIVEVKQLAQDIIEWCDSDEVQALTLQKAVQSDA